MSGHGHVNPNPDGSKARCGGPALCAECARELATEQATITAKLSTSPPDQPPPAVTVAAADPSAPLSLAEMQAEVVENNRAKGWHDNPPSFPECIAMLHSEVSEALEAWRVHGTADATCPWDGVHKPEGVGSEFADILIRLLDDCHLFGVDLEAEYRRKMAYNRTRSFRHGGKRI